MTRSQYFRNIASDRAGILAVDTLVRLTTDAFRRGDISSVTLVKALRAAGACEPEIKAALASALADHLED